MSIYYYGKSSRDSQYYFRLKDNNNEIILASSEGYATESGCLNGIESVRKNSTHDDKYVRFTGGDARHYFRLKAANGEIIGRSEGYTTAWSREQGVENCKVEAPGAVVMKVEEV